jgi:hypothetical protein
MREYWSLSNFANFVRDTFDIPRHPVAANIEQWNQWHIDEKSTTKRRIVTTALDGLDSLQSLVYFIPEKISSAIYYLSNWKNSRHVMVTRKKRGEWCEVDAKIEDGLMFELINFVEDQCYHMMAICHKDDVRFKDYNKQSYFTRKLFPRNDNLQSRGEIGLEWLQYQHDYCDANGKKAYAAIIAAYHFAKTEWKDFPTNLDAMYDEVTGASDDVVHSIYTRIRKFEEAFKKKETKHLTNIVKYRSYLWT